MRLTCELDGVTDVQATLQGAATRAVSLPVVAFPVIVEDFWRMEQRRFDDAGPEWAPLSPATIAIKQARESPNPDRVMVDSGDLMASLTGDTPDTVHVVTPDSLLIGTSLPYAKYHQNGPRQIKVFGVASATLPQRRLVELDEIDAARWASIVQRALSGELL